MSLKTITVTVGNNLNAIVKDGTNVNAVVSFQPNGIQKVSTPQISGGGGSAPFSLNFDSNELQLTINAYANTLGNAPEVIVPIPLDATSLSVDLEGTHNGKIDIETSFKTD
jgi:hypothetical protein